VKQTELVQNCKKVEAKQNKIAKTSEIPKRRKNTSSGLTIKKLTPFAAISLLRKGPAAWT
jgi:hypothetical protein